MSLPPFELLYQRHRDELYGYMCARLAREDAADAFQETFLRALRTYERLEHARELRGWLFTIARSVLADRGRRAATRPVEVPAALADTSAAPVGADSAAHTADDPSLAELTQGLPRKERAAVVLRYGFDLDYDDIGAALDSSSDAARQATSSGVRRLRQQLTPDAESSGERKPASRKVGHDTGTC